MLLSSVGSPKRLVMALMILSMYVVLTVAFLYNVKLHALHSIKTTRDYVTNGNHNNITSRIKGRVIYNRVGKCGSRSMVALISALATKNHFKIVDSSYDGILDPEQRKLSINQQKVFVTHINKLKPPFILHGHFHFIDFSKYGSAVPIYVNLIRDPLERFTSAYYFKRFGDGRNRTWKFKGTENEKIRTLGECVLKNHSECTNPNKLLYIIPYFCGQPKGCRGSSLGSLRKAMRNVQNKYRVVGVLEDMNSFIKVLEKLLPEFFKGAYQNAIKIGSSSKRLSTMTKNKRTLSPEARALLKRRLRLEYRFYNFVKAKFNKLKKQLKIN